MAYLPYNKFENTLRRKMDNFEVIFYEGANGDKPVEDFLNSLDIKIRSKLLMILNVL